MRDVSILLNRYVAIEAERRLKPMRDTPYQEWTAEHAKLARERHTYLVCNPENTVEGIRGRKKELGWLSYRLDRHDAKIASRDARRRRR